MENEILEAERQRNEIIKRIQEKERLINLIQSRHVKGGLNEIKEFQDKYNLQKEKENEINLKQEPTKLTFSKEMEKEKDIEKEMKKSKMKEISEKELASIKFNSFQQGVNYITMVKKVQRAYRNYILLKNKKKKRSEYLYKLKKEFYKPISFERGVELRKMLIDRLKQWKVPENDYEEIVNRYYDEYKDFCLSFPQKEKIREDNFYVYFQCLDLLNYMDNIRPETALKECNQFKSFMLNKNKEFSTKLLLDEMERQYKYKNDVYEYNTIDEFEENNLLDEIDNRYNFEPRSSILNKKK